MRGKTVFKVRSYECGADSRATLPTICNYLQEAASVNAEHLGCSPLVNVLTLKECFRHDFIA